MSRRCFVTGIGLITPYGVGVELFWRGLLSQNSAIRQSTRFDSAGMPSRWFGELPSLDFGALLALSVPASYSSPAEAAPARQVASVIVDGQGSGHGRGLSAWGAYGSAVNRGWSWQQILDYYYGGDGPPQPMPRLP